MEYQQIIKEKLLQTKNDKNLSKYIIEFIGDNCCQKCYEHCDYPLTNVLSFDKTKGDYQFRDLPGANYILKKFCKKCIRGRASSCKIYIEIN